MTETPITGWAWHVHHAILCEPLTGEGIAKRQAYIRAAKPLEEQALRLKLLRPLIGPLHDGLVPARQAHRTVQQAYRTALSAHSTADLASDTARQAYSTADLASDTALQAHDTAQQDYRTAEQAYRTALQDYRTARQDYRTAQQAYDTVLSAYLPELLSLHAAECEPDCPWDGSTIFAGGTR